jgi:hypothetical protein
MGYYSHAVGTYSTANGQCSHAEVSYNVAGNSEIDSWEQMVNIFYKLNMTVKDTANAIQNLQQVLYNQLGTPASLITENPKQKSDLEISNRIEISDEFLNLKTDN